MTIPVITQLGRMVLALMATIGAVAGRWSIAYRAPLDFDLQRRDGPHYRITALDEEPR